MLEDISVNDDSWGWTLVGKTDGDKTLPAPGSKWRESHDKRFYKWEVFPARVEVGRVFNWGMILPSVEQHSLVMLEIVQPT